MKRTSAIGGFLVALILLVSAYFWIISFPYEYQAKRFLTNNESHLNALADELERSTDFDEFICWSDTVWVENSISGAKRELQAGLRQKFLALCSTARIPTGKKIENGEFFHIESAEKRGKPTKSVEYVNRPARLLVAGWSR